MRPAALRAHCLSFPGAEETFPFGPSTSVFKVAGRMFALSRLAARPLQVSLKCEPLLAEELRAAHAAVLPGYHLNKRHWNTVTIDGTLPAQMIEEMIEDSYDLVVSRLPEPHRHALGWTGTKQRPGRGDTRSSSRATSQSSLPCRRSASGAGTGSRRRSRVIHGAAPRAYLLS